MKRLIFLSLIFISCNKPKDNPIENIIPRVYLFVESINDTITGRQVFYWYGNDPDGEIIGYYIAKDDTSNKVFTTKNYDTIYFEAGKFPENHLFCVWAIDNLNAISIPKCINLLVKNAPPVISFVNGTLPPDTILPVATFYFKYYDEDGNSTIKGLMYRFDYEQNWHVIDTPYERITLKNFQSGNRRVYFKAFDENGGISDSISYGFYVIEKMGDILVVDDDISYDGSFYRNLLNINGYLYTYWNADRKYPYSVFDVNAIVNELGFNTIIWFSGENKSNIRKSYVAFQNYLNSNKKLVIISGHFIDAMRDTIYGGYLSFLKNYAGVDSVYYLNKVYLSRMSLISDNYPSPLKSNSPVITMLDGVLIKNTSTKIYELSDPNCDNFNWRWNGSTCDTNLPVPTLAWKSNKFYILTFPLHKFNTNTNNENFFIQILNE
ncbi:MAG: hypothetical protein N2504_04165 [candidate division WOR-3 bacterium]|nr:hypothetical protein [candidate division WOR-3 bacterium]MCX7947763.1 hypothetical protein [candidate division WOR-3 bacterium]MDW8150313.1 hypothetical protein [candidate division WOR-3 bacterium]